MTPKHQIFVDEYLIDLNAAQAAERAGFVKTTAATLMSNPAIATAIVEKLANRSAILGIDAEWVLRRAADLADFNIEKFITVHNGSAVYDFSTATPRDWYCISEITTKAIRRGDGVLIPVEEVKIKAFDKLRALELVGKHVNVQAFKDRIEHSGHVTYDKIERTIVDTPDTDS